MLAEIGGCFVRFFCYGMPTMAHHLLLVNPPQQEEIAESGILMSTNQHMQTAAHEIRECLSHNGSPRIVLHIGHHIIQLAAAHADSIVVVVIKKRTHSESRLGCIIFFASHFRQPTYHSSFIWPNPPPEFNWRVRARTCLRQQSPPAAGAGRLERLHNIPHALVHPLLHPNDAVPMVGHHHLSKRPYPSSFTRLNNSRFIPFFPHNISQLGQIHPRGTQVHI